MSPEIVNDPGCDAYLVFHGLKHHFTGDYDYFQYNGHLKNFSAETYQKIPLAERRLYEKFAKKYRTRFDLEHFMVASICSHRKSW